MITCRKSVAFVMLLFGVQLAEGALSSNYYSTTCPFAEFTVRNTVNQALRTDPTLAGGLLRLHFHDCFVQVLNIQMHASVHHHLLQFDQFFSAIIGM